MVKKKDGKESESSIYNGNILGDGLTSSDLNCIPHHCQHYTPGFSADIGFKKCLFRVETP